jgi:nigerose phosphorylase
MINGLIMNWNITESNRLSSEDIDRQGNKLLIGNGYIGYRGTLDEFTREQKTATIVSGLYDQVGEAWREPVNLPNGGLIQVIYKGESLHALTSKVIDHCQGLNLRTAIHERRTIFEAADGTHICIKSRRFVSLARRQLLCIEYSIEADHDVDVDIRTGIDADVWDINGPHLEKIIALEQAGILSVTSSTHENGVVVAVSESIAGLEQTHLGDYQFERNGIEEEKGKPGRICLFHELPVKNGLTFYKYISHMTGLEEESPLETSRNLCIEAASLGFDVLLKEHSALWQQRWEACDIQIEGDPEAQQAMRFSLYHLLSIVPAHSQNASIPARGMSGQMYKGAIFWDTEIFMLPFFSYTFPAYARNLLLYRYHTLAGARRKAREYGHKGAFYAWESQDTGDDACSLFNVTDVFTHRPVRTYFRDKQIHISADIPYAFWQYYTVTGDDSIWQDGGAEVVFECARFFLSCLYYNPGKRRYEILDVTGADEYHERVHNNAFTNRMVAHTLDICQRIAKNLLATAPDFYDQLMRSLDFDADLASISDASSALFQPDLTASGNLIPQFDDYFALENPSIEALLNRRLHPNEYLGGGNGLATTTQIIKQADVVLMLYLFGDRYTIATKQANWEYYEPRTEHGSSLSPCSYAVVASHLGKLNWAYKYFMKTATIDLIGNGKQYAGDLYIGGTHPAGSGGAWIAIVTGFCGLECSRSTIVLHPNLPAQWQKVTLPIIFHNQRLRISITHEYVAITPVDPLSESLSLTVNDSIYSLHSNGELTIPIQNLLERQ